MLTLTTCTVNCNINLYMHVMFEEIKPAKY